MLGKSLFAWKSKKRYVVARSTTEADNMSMVMTVCEVMLFKQLIKELSIRNLSSTPIFCDNYWVALATSANLMHHDKIKHVENDCHFIRDRAEEGVITPSYISTYQ